MVTSISKGNMKTTSLELSKKLKSAGVEQESEFYWLEFDNTACVCSKEGCDCVRGKYHTKHLSQVVSYNDVDDFKMRNYLKNIKEVSAFTAEEISEMLPESFMDFNTDPRSGKEVWELSIYKSHGYVKNVWEVVYISKNGVEHHSEVEKSMAEAMGKCLLYLTENNLTK